MGLPLAKNTQAFSSDQKTTFRAYYWNTTSTAIRLGEAHLVNERLTAFGAGVGFAMFDLLDPTFKPSTPAALEAGLAKTSGKTKAILDYDESGAYRVGVVPVIYDYWGSGAPVGGTRAKQVVMKYTGYITQPVSNATLVFAGQGTVMAVVTRGGVSTTLVNGAISEPTPSVDTSRVTAATITGEWGYQFNTTPYSFQAGDKLDIYYIHNGESWGGLCAKVFPGAIRTDVNFLTDLRNATVIGASFLAKDAGTLPALTIPYVIDAEIRPQLGAVPEARVRVALTDASESDGWVYVKENGEEFLRDNKDVTNTLKKGRAIHVVGGFVVPLGGEEVYPRFTGYIDDIYPDNDGAALVTCRGFEGKLAEPFDTNNPDRLSYQANGYIRREGSGEPVFGIPAYDNWPLEVVVRDLCARSGIDDYNVGRSPASLTPEFGMARFITNTTGTLTFGAALVNAKSLATQIPVVLERQSNYGNVSPLQKDYLPKDDAYLFPPSVTQRVWDRLKSLTDHYGYDFFFNTEGRAVLQGRNNATGFQYMTQPGAYGTYPVSQYQQTEVDAVGGIALVRQDTDAAWSRQFSAKCSRVDLYVGIGANDSGLNGGKLSVLIEKKLANGTYTPVSTTVHSTWFDGPEAYYYSSVSRTDGTNAAVLRILALPFDDYRVTISPVGPDQGEAHCLYRINGAAVFERDPEQTFYNADGTIRTFSTLKNAMKVDPESTFKDLRNHVIVVGQRKATVTDSEKLNGENTNPNNPEVEFNVAVAADPFSIYDPTSANFVGGKRMTVVFDDKIGNGDFAKYLARTILFQYRLPKARARTDHTIVPTLELRDAVYVVDEKNKTIDHMQWVSGYSEKWSVEGTALCTIDGLANPELPSYQPREDVDIDAFFVDTRDGLGEPLVNFALSYLNLYGESVSNSDLTNVAGITAFATRTRGSSTPMMSEAISGAEVNTKVLTKPLIPETLYLSWNKNNTATEPPTVGVPPLTTQAVKKRALVNMPYRHFWHITSWNAASHVPTLSFQFEEGDGTTGVYDKTFYDFPNLNGGQWYVNYDYLTVRTGKNPFYDPYTSELGNLVSIKFDLLVKGRLRVSLWDANRPDGRTEIPVAWLTNPTGQSDEPEAHWAYSDPGKGLEFLWDGIDNIGFYNTIMSSAFAREMAGSFGDKAVGVSKGFYAWNDESTNPFTLIGDTHANNFGADGSAYFTIGKFGRFYVKVEVLNDDLVRKDLLATGTITPRTVTSDSLPTANSMNDVAEVYAWTHLGEPTQVALRIQDWASYPAKKWTRQTVYSAADWSTTYSTPDAAASIADGKPVRITFVPLARRGFMWEDSNGNLDPTLIGVKLTRELAMQATVFDQFWTLYGTAWEHLEEYKARGIEKKRLTNRMYHAEIETLEFEDQAFRTGASLQSFEWIFDPSLFMKDFGKGFAERLQYGDYTQITTLPNFDSKKLGGTSNGVRDYMMLAFINYLFYFSAHTLDRSGRRQWCLNSYTEANKKRGFIDRTKIASSNWQSASNDPASGNYRPWAIVDYETRGADQYLARSIFARQWVEPGWKTGTYTESPVTKYGISDAHDLKFVQPNVIDFDLDTPGLNDDAQRTERHDAWLEAYRVFDSEANRQVHRHGTGASRETINLGSLSPAMFGKLPSLGTWTFDRPGVEGFFRPAPIRDFHPYWRYPDMPDWASQFLYVYATTASLDGFASIGLDILSSVATQINYSLRDPAAQHIWYGYAFSDTQLTTYTKGNGARTERTVEELLGEAKNKNSERVNSVGASATEGDIKGLFDYSRQDELSRFDNFRGVISRAPYSDRQAPEDTKWLDGQSRRSSNPQPVKPSGVYLYNLGRYNRYTLANPAAWDSHRNAQILHYVERVTEWPRIAFPHEYVWYSPKYFPVDPSGFSVYGFFKTEFTGAREWVGPSWWYATSLIGRGNTRTAKPRGSAFDPKVATTFVFDIYFDAGAWTGWKWDVKAADWSADPKLRWQEHGCAVVYQGTRDATLGGVSGGASFGANAWASSPTGIAKVTEPWMDKDHTAYVRANIFDDYYCVGAGPRLAVGPEIPEARTLVMNLSLADSLRE